MASDTEKSFQSLLSQIEKARSESKKFVESWDDVGRKIKESLSPLKSVNDQIETSDASLSRGNRAGHGRGTGGGALLATPYQQVELVCPGPGRAGDHRQRTPDSERAL